LAVVLRRQELADVAVDRVVQSRRAGGLFLGELLRGLGSRVDAYRRYGIPSF
jgi:hypothetical protein